MPLLFFAVASRAPTTGSNTPTYRGMAAAASRPSSKLHLPSIVVGGGPLPPGADDEMRAYAADPDGGGGGGSFASSSRTRTAELQTMLRAGPAALAERIREMETRAAQLQAQEQELLREMGLPPSATGVGAAVLVVGGGGAGAGAKR